MYILKTVNFAIHITVLKICLPEFPLPCLDQNFQHTSTVIARFSISWTTRSTRATHFLRTPTQQKAARLTDPTTVINDAAGKGPGDVHLRAQNLHVTVIDPTATHDTVKKIADQNEARQIADTENRGHRVVIHHDVAGKGRVNQPENGAEIHQFREAVHLPGATIKAVVTEST